ncbi:MAG: MBL fold metallo-hydrolase, partial [Kiritimatiellaeota bacterium]|nr:MBL fold metallo-hydrolase [Kiritimatiellota bacterium]
MPNVQGFDKADTSLLGVVISHPHQDHYGLAARVPPTTPFLMGAATQQILATAMVFTPSGGKFANVIHLVDRKPINLGPFKLTPFLMDHSAFDSYAMLLEADGRKVFYTGDLRAHGYKAKLFERLVQHPPAAVDVLLMEGTTIGRKDTGERYQTEAELIPEFVRLFSATKGMALVWCSGQNIDRLVTLFKAARQAKRQFIVDMYTAAILDATGNEKIRAALHNNMRVFLPKSQKKQILVQGRFDVSNQYKALRIYPEELPDAASRSVMLFRPSMCQEVEQEHCLDGAELIYSMWDGYLKEKKTEWFLTWLKEHDIPLRKCHTSGHAPLCDLQRLRKAFASAVVVPVHCAEPENFVAHFGNVVRHADNEWWTVEHGKHPAGALNMNKLKENRGLSPKFVRDLCEGTLKPILERVQGDRTLDMEIRKEYINIYYRGGNLLKISPVAGTVGYDAFFDVQYGLPSDVEKFVTHSSDPETWVKQIPVLKDTMD